MTKRGRLRTITAASLGLGAPTGSAGLPGQDDEGWQSQAWGYYDSVGELRYVCSWLSNALSRCTLVASDVNMDTGQPTGTTEDERVVGMVSDIAGGPAGQATLLGKLATYLTVPGDAWVAILDRDGSEEWHVVSTDEVVRRAGGRGVTVLLPDGTEHRVNTETDTLTRVYRPHPRNQRQADSPVRAALPILREIVRLGQYVEATAKSRLASNGILAVPNELSLPSQKAPPPAADPDAPGLPAPTPEGYGLPDDDPLDYGDHDHTGPEGLVDAMLETFQIAVQEPGSAAALAPIVLQGPGDQLANIQHISLGTEFTDTVMKLREAATKRLALALDVPAEVLLGIGSANHWSAWAIEESAIKLHVEPLLTLICDRLTEHVLRPLLVRHGHPDPDSAVIWFSTAGLSQRPNRTEEARIAWQAGAVGVETYRREAGWDDTDAPVQDDQAEQRDLARQLVLRDPSLLRVLAPYLGMEGLADVPLSERERRRGAPEGPVSSSEDGEGPPAEPTSNRPADSGSSGPSAAALAQARVAVLSLVQRRLELAGNRLRTRANLASLDGVPAHATHLTVPVPREALGRLLRAPGGTAVLARAAGCDPDRLEDLVRRLTSDALMGRIPLARVGDNLSDDTLASVLDGRG